MAWLPKTLRVGYETYKVSLMPKSEKETEGDFGCHSQLIRVRVAGRSPRFIANTLLHEAMHAIFYQAGLKESAGISFSKEEAIVNCLANGLSQVFRDNPELAKMLTK
jgi:hypothetical protein